MEAERDASMRFKKGLQAAERRIHFLESPTVSLSGQVGAEKGALPIVSSQRLIAPTFYTAIP